MVADGAAFYRPKGCDACMNTGYRGRTALFEMLTLTDTVREMIDSRAPDHQLRAAAKESGMTSLRDAGLMQAAAGMTSLEEVFRVSQERGGNQRTEGGR